MQDKLLITRKIKKTIDYIEKAIENYPHRYNSLKNKIMDSCYELLELSYQANITKDINFMKNIIVKIRMLEYYIKTSLDKKLINYTKFENIGNYLIEINKMVNIWVKSEKTK